jgi:hypothetical protein
MVSFIGPSVNKMIELNYEKIILNCKLTSSDKKLLKTQYLSPYVLKGMKSHSRNPNHQGLFNNIMSLLVPIL